MLPACYSELFAIYARIARRHEYSCRGEPGSLVGVCFPIQDAPLCCAIRKGSPTVMTTTIGLVVSLLVVVVVLSALATRIALPSPIVLVVGGLLLSFLPGLPTIDLAPDLVLFVFLPPLIYASAWQTSWREFHANLRPILLLAIGLVLVTTTLVAVVAHALVGLPWGVAFVLGAIVSPTDAVAASATAQRVGLARRLVTVLEGESMVNDATGLVIYRFAVAAVVSGMFSLGRGSAVRRGRRRWLTPRSRGQLADRAAPSRAGRCADRDHHHVVDAICGISMRRSRACVRCAGGAGRRVVSQPAVGPLFLVHDPPPGQRGVGGVGLSAQWPAVRADRATNEPNHHGHCRVAVAGDTRRCPGHLSDSDPDAGGMGLSRDLLATRAERTAASGRPIPWLAQCAADCVGRVARGPVVSGGVRPTLHDRHGGSVSRTRPNHLFDLLRHCGHAGGARRGLGSFDSAVGPASRLGAGRGVTVCAPGRDRRGLTATRRRGERRWYARTVS